MIRRFGLTIVPMLLATALGRTSADATVTYRAEAGWLFFASEVFDIETGNTPGQTVTFTRGGVPCPAPTGPNYICAHAFAKADLVDGRRIALRADARLKRVDSNGLSFQELVYAFADVSLFNLEVVSPSPVGYAYVNLALSGTRTATASDASLVPQAFVTVTVNGVVVQCDGVVCPPLRVPDFGGSLRMQLRSDARVTNPNAGMFSGWDAEMVANYRDTLELVSIVLHDVNDQPIPGAQIFVGDGSGNRLFDIPATADPTTTTTTIPGGSTTTSTTTTAVTTSTTSSTLPPLDPYRCYPGKTTKGTPKLAARTVRLADALGDTSVIVNAVDSLCHPAGVDGSGIANSTAALACYDTKAPKGAPKFQQRDVQTSDRFGELSVRLSGAASLCVPSEADGVAAPFPVDHVQCYRAKVMKGAPAFVQRTVAVTDGLEARNVIVQKPVLLCAAADKNAEGVRRPSDRLVCYATKDVKGQADFAKRTSAVTNQLGELSLDLKGSKTLCVPATAVLSD